MRLFLPLRVAAVQYLKMKESKIVAIKTAMVALLASAVLFGCDNAAENERLQRANGNVIKKELNGITLVPQNPIRYDVNYSELCAEAARQEREELDAASSVSEKYQDAIRAKVNELMSTASIVISVRTK